jgi:hypothetical protein
MAMDDVSTGNPIPVEKLARIYLKMRDKKSEITKEFDAQIASIESGMKQVKAEILEHMKAIGAESIRTESGTVYRTIRKVYSTTDWESMHKFILEHQAPELLEKRIQQTNMTAFLEENPDLLPPGLNANMEYSVNVRRS